MSPAITGQYDLQFYIVNDFNQVVESVSSTGSGPNTVYNSFPIVAGSMNQNISTSGYPEGEYTMVKSINVNEAFLETQYQTYKTSLETEMNQQLSFWEHQLKNYYLSTYGYSGTNSGNVSNPCIPIELPTVEPCDLDCDNACENELRELQFNASNSTFYYKYYYYDETDNDTRKLDPVQSTHLKYTIDVNACQESCKDPSPYDNDISDCERMKQNLLKDLSPGGQYFDNTPKQYVVNNITGTFTGPDGNRQEVSNYNCASPGCQGAVINAWLENHSGVNALLGTSALNGLDTWDDVRVNWDDAFALELLRFHPEISYYNFHCLGAINVSGLDREGKPISSSVSMPNAINKYREQMYMNTNGCSDFTINSTSYNGALPFGGQEYTSITHFNLVSYDFCPTSLSYTSDPFLFYTTIQSGVLQTNTKHDYGNVQVNVDAQILEKLQNFAVDPSNPSGYQSLWLILNNVTYPPYNALWPNELQGIYKSIHGSASGANDGVVGPGKMTKYDYFRAVYDFYRSHFIYQYFNYVHNPLPWQLDVTFTGNIEDWSTPSRLTATTEDDYRLNFVENAIYAGIYADGYAQSPKFNIFNPTSGLMSSMNPSAALPQQLSAQFNSYQKELIYNECVGTVAQLMIELYDNGDGCLQGLSTNEIADLRKNLVILCQAGGIQARDAIATHNTSSSSNLTQLQLNKYQLGAMSGMTSLILSLIHI